MVSLLRGDDYRRQGRAVSKGIVRYRHQGGGQDHTTQIIVIYKSIKEEMREGFEFIFIHATNERTIRSGCLPLNAYPPRKVTVLRETEQEEVRAANQNVFHFKRKRCI